MTIRRSIFAALLSLLSLSAMAQGGRQAIEIDYNHPRSYVLGGVEVEGNTYFGSSQIINQTGLYPGMTLTIPGEEVSNVVSRLWAQRYFEDVAVAIDSLSAARDTAWLKIIIQERPRVSRWSFSGIRNSERKDLQDRLKLRPGREFSDYVEKTSVDIIKRYFKEKGFQLAEVAVETVRDSVIRSAIRVNFNINKGERVRIRDIHFSGNTDVSDFKLARSMKKTKSNKIYNLFSSKKFNEQEYENDKRSAIAKFNEAGYRDARIVRDSVYYIEPNRLAIDLDFDQGRRYYFRDIKWTGNSVYSTDQLNSILQIKKGDVYDMVTLNKRLYGGGKQTDYDISKLYRDNGFLFVQLNAVEMNIQNDSVDIELRISEGKQATLNNIIINGNDLTNERVVRRQVATRPGYLFRQSDFERSIREIASLGQFDAESISSPEGGYNILPNQNNNTVDIVYNVTEKPSSQLELSGGWGGNTFVATAGVSFNNFSTRRVFDKKAWRPVPLGDAQNLSFRFQTNGTYYTAISASFVEPWLFGKKPTSLSLSGYYTRQSGTYYWDQLQGKKPTEFFEVYGVSAGLGKRLKWPDDFFVLYNALSWQTYRLTNWSYNNFIFNDGTSHNISYNLSLSRNSTDQQIYPRSGSDFSLSLQLTPPFSLLRKYTYDAEGRKVPVASYKDVDYDSWTARQRFKWIEYHKWKFSGAVYTKLIGDLVLMTRAQFGYLGYYNRRWGYSPFEGFLVGGDGMSGYNMYGSDIVSLRGYQNYSLTPTETTRYSSSYSYAGHVYDKFTVELRYPLILQPQSTIFALVFLEGGNAWSDIRSFNPFQIKRSAGIGARVFLPMIGLLGIDWGYGFDDATNGKSQFHFVIGQQF